MKRWHALGLITVLWAGIYLPALGSLEIKGEEGRRILPARTMLTTGNWLVPYVGGKPYERKPPLINWLIAASFKTFGVVNEWTARAPSALCILFLALAMVWLITPWLGTDVALISGIFAMTHLGTLEKGRLAELEALYVALGGLAMIAWLAWFATDRSRWLTWVAPFLLLGLGLLAKGPLHLLFFYALAIPVAWRFGRARELWSPPHFAGILLMAAMFAAWAVPYNLATPDLNTGGVWKEQFVGRISHNTFDLKGWLLTIPRSLSNFLPWVLFAPLLWRSETVATFSGSDALLFRTLRNATTACFFGLLLVPGVLPRYTQPLLVPACLSIAMVLTRAVTTQPGWTFAAWKTATTIGLALVSAAALAAPFIERETVTVVVSLLVLAGSLGLVLIRRGMPLEPRSLAIASAIVIALAVMLTAATVVPRLNAADNIRPLGRAIDARIPAGTPLYVLAPNYQPALFYLSDEPRCVALLEEVPPHAEYLLVRPGTTGAARARWDSVRVIETFIDKDAGRFLLLQVSGPIQKDATFRAGEESL